MSREGAWIAVAALNGLVAVAVGAVAAHGTEAAGAAQAWLATGSRYQLWHALALLAVILLRRGSDAGRLLDAARWAFLAGILLFSGSLYVMALTADRWLAWLTPVGGASFLIGWAALAGHGLAGRRTS